jgi:hypothetical protein
MMEEARFAKRSYQGIGLLVHRRPPAGLFRSLAGLGVFGAVWLSAEWFGHSFAPEVAVRLF